MKKIIVSILIIGLLFITPIANGIAFDVGRDVSGTKQSAGSSIPQVGYGFIITVYSSQSEDIQVNISRLLNELLENNVSIYWITSNITVLSLKLLMNENVVSRNILKGSYIVPFANNASLDLIMTTIIYRYNNTNHVEILMLMEPLSNLEVYRLNEPRIAYHSGHIDGWGSIEWEIYHEALEYCGFLHGKVLGWDNISEILNNNDFNVFVWGGNAGDSYYFETLFHPLAIQTIREFVSNGGGYVGSCYGGWVIGAGNLLPWNWVKPYIPEIPTWMFLGFSSRRVFQALPGIGKIIINIVDLDCPVAFGLPQVVKTDYIKGPLFLGSQGKTRTVARLNNTDPNNWGWDSMIPESLRTIWINFAINKPIWVTTEFGKGKVVAFGDHPEHVYHIYGRIVSNAVFYASSKGPYYIDIQNSQSQPQSNSRSTQILQNQQNSQNLALSQAVNQLATTQLYLAGSTTLLGETTSRQNTIN